MNEGFVKSGILEGLVPRVVVASMKTIHQLKKLCPRLNFANSNINQNTDITVTVPLYISSKNKSS
jgi:hypothetical protein